MQGSVADQHLAEVKKGERFQFGKNWAKFLKTFTEERLVQAERSLQAGLSSTRLDGKTFIDIGSGSGLFSLAARRLGASVFSFDYDTNSVACTNELRRRFFPNDASWTVEQGSVLDRVYLAKLGSFDIVYSWGVLHHTGQMWDALDNVKPLVKQGGQLYIAIYNELHPLTDRWLSIKRTYNRLPSIARWPFAVAIIAALESRAFIHFARHRTVREYLRLWTHYHSVRGMSKWHDWFDWIGGYPYECATIEELAEYFGKDGFALEWLESRATGTGCNELSFRRVAGVGEWVDNLIAKSSLVVGRFGRRVNGPFHADKEGYVARLPKSLSTRRAGDLVLFHDGELVGSAAPGGQPGTIIVAPPSWPMERVAATKIHVVAGSCRTLEATDVQKSQEHSFRVAVPDLQHVSDDKTPSRDRSPVFVFEDKRQLAMPHALHAEIVAFGQGRFSHWADYILFSTSDNSDPRSNGRSYELVAAELDDD